LAGAVAIAGVISVLVFVRPVVAAPHEVAPDELLVS
jgi:hypothetical protein